MRKNTGDLATYIQDRVSVEDRGFSTACWIWQRQLNARGYGKGTHRERDRKFLVHRVAYEVLIGPIPEGLTIDHLCRVKACCNPAHLEPVTLAENVRRKVWVQSPTCRNGHEYIPSNIYFARGHRNCRACRREATRRYGAKVRTKER